MERLRDYYCHGNATTHSLFIVAGVAVAVNNGSVQCCHGDVTMGTLCTVVEL
jgi:hypothetical protein